MREDAYIWLSLLEANFRSLLPILGLDAHIGFWLETVLLTQKSINRNQVNNVHCKKLHRNEHVLVDILRPSINRVCIKNPKYQTAWLVK
jgi:hypothetical protein